MSNDEASVSGDDAEKFQLIRLGGKSGKNIVSAKIAQTGNWFSRYRDAFMRDVAERENRKKSNKA